MLKRKSEMVSKIRFYYGLFLICWAISRGLFIASDYVLDKEGATFLNIQLILIGYLVMILSFTALIFNIEKNIKSPASMTTTKITLVGDFGLIGFWIGSIFSTKVEIYARIFAYIITSIVSVIIFFFLLFLALKLVGKIRKIALLNLLAICLIFAGHVLDSRLLAPFYYDIIWFPALLSLTGSILFYYVQKKSEK